MIMLLSTTVCGLCFDDSTYIRTHTHRDMYACMYNSINIYLYIYIYIYVHTHSMYIVLCLRFGPFAL